MDNCFVPCGCDENEGITRADFDRFTDTIENVLNDERGRKLFRNFMRTSKLEDGRRALIVWELIEKLLTYEETEESGSQTHQHWLKEVDILLKKADRIDEVEFTTMERITTARQADNREGIIEGLQSLKLEVVKALRREYSAFRQRFTPRQ